MPWTKLFKVKSFDAALKKRRKIFHIDPILTGRELAKVTKVFKMVDIPFVWNEKEVMRENNRNSPFHKFPKGIYKKEKVYFERVQKLRNGIEAAKEKELKYRQESLNKRPYKGFENMIKLTMPFMIKQTSLKPEGEFGRAKGRKMVAEFVKEVPRIKNISFGRRKQEKVKNLLEDKVLDVTSLTEISKRKPKEKPGQKEEAQQPKSTGAAPAATKTTTPAKNNKESLSKKILDTVVSASESSDDD